MEQLLAEDGDLLRRNVGERAICGRLARHLEPFFPNHRVDVEYDRHGLDRQTLALPARCRGGGRRKVIPDVVIHQRGHDRENLVAIELKKSTNPEPRDCDFAKLAGMIEQLQYREAVFIEVPSGAGSNERRARIEWL